MPTPPGLEVTDRIRTAIITAVFSVDSIYDKLALKGGNALRLVYAIQDRTSLDLDFSLEGDFPNFEETREALFRALGDRLDSAGFHVFDLQMTARPPHASGTWGGYRLELKVITREGYQACGGDIGRLRRQAVELSAAHNRTWTVEISKFEYCGPKKKLELDHHTIFVYTPEMIVIEKLRALCQQMPEYSKRGHPAPRARDFYDIFEVMQQLTSRDVLRLPENAVLARAIFAAKEVPINLLAKIRATRDFHATDWPSVEQAVLGTLHPFNTYFDFVSRLAQELEPLWNEETPAG